MRVRHFVLHRFPVAALLFGSLLGSVVSPATAVAQSKSHVWKLQSSWPQANLLTESVTALVKSIDEMSAGRLKIDAAPAGQLVPAFEVLEATHKGVLDAAHSWPGY